MKNTLRLGLLSALLGLAACDEPVEPADGGAHDAAIPTDAGGDEDASVGPDAAPDEDAGPGVEDAGPADAGADDAGPAIADGGGDAGIDPAAIPAPQPIEPWSTSFTTSPNVRFRWALTAPADGARLEVCRDPACADVRETMDVTGETASTLVPPDPGATSRVFYFRLTGRAGDVLGRDRSAVWAFSVSGRVSVPSGATWGTTHDLDGDGLSELVASAPTASTVRVYRGRTPIGGAPAPDTTISAAPALALGTAVTGVGDVNGDGLGDLAVATADQVLVFHGRAGGLAPSLSVAGADATLTGVGAPTQATVAGAGDVDRDGYADVVVALPGSVVLYRGGPSGVDPSGTPLDRADAGFGRSVAGGCDVNADGYADVVVGADEAAFVLLGEAAGLGTVVDLVPGVEGMGFGAAVACAGDVDGDGFPDVIVGAPTDHAAFVFSGSSTGIASFASGVLRKQPGETGVPTKHGESFGAVVAAAGDVNGDGFGDVVVVAPDIATGLAPTDFVGYAFVFHGSATGVGSTSAGASTSHARALGSSMSFAQNRITTARGAGDMDGDGFADLVSGAPNRDAGAGGVLLNMGSSSGVPTTSVWLLGGGGLVGFGTAVAARWVAGRLVWPT